MSARKIWVTAAALLAICAMMFFAPGCTVAPVPAAEPTITATPFTSTLVNQTATPFPAPAPTPGDGQKLDDFTRLVAEFSGREPSEARTALDALLALTTPLPDEAMDTFLAFMERLCDDLDVPDVIGWTGNHGEQTQAEFACYLMRLYTSEGYVWAVPDLAAIGVCLYGKTSPAYEAFFGFAMLERERGIFQLVNDGMLNISWRNLADYIGGRQAFCSAYPDFSQTEKLLAEVSLAVSWYEGTNPLPHSPPFNQKELRPEARESYEYFLETYRRLEGTGAYDRIAHAERLWRENHDRLTSDVKVFLGLTR